MKFDAPERVKRMQRRTLTTLCFLWFGLVLGNGGGGATAQTGAARFEITDQTIATAVPAITATIGAFGAGTHLMTGGTFEPKIQRDWFLVTADAPADAPGEIHAKPSSISRYDTLRDGALDGAEVSLLRLSNGKLEEIRSGRIARDGYHVSGWFRALGKRQAVPSDRTEATLRIAPYERSGVPRWYAVRAIGKNGQLSPYSDPVEIMVPDEIDGKKSAESKLIKLDYDPDANPADRGPAAPSNLSARIDQAGQVQLDWDAPPNASDVAGYAIYKSDVAPEDMQGFFIETESKGERVRAGDLVIIRGELTDLRRETFVSNRVWNARAGGILQPRPVNFFPADEPRRDWRLVRHPEEPARNWGGRTFLQVDLPDRETAKIGSYALSGTGQTHYEVLRPKQPYKVSVRLRGERPGRAVLTLSGDIGRTMRPVILPYGTDWQEITAEFTIPRIDTGSRPERIDLEIRGPGRIDVDDFRIHRADTAYLDYSDEDYLRLHESGVSSLRTHGLIKTGNSTYDLTALLGTGGIELGRSQVAGLPETLATMEKAGVAPWLQIEPHFADREWLGLVEYLAAPFDPDTDDPEALPWAALRVAQGRRAPWTDAFDRIYLELGNETWNRLFRPWVFPAMTDAATGQAASPGEIYGLFQSRVAGIMRSSPWWDAADLDEKVDFVIGGRNRFDYGARAAAAAPTASDVMAIAAYNGGWDEGEGPPRRTKASYFNVLNQVSQSTIPSARQNMEFARKISAEQGRDLVVGTYEAGPGYALDGLNRAKVTDEQAREQEAVMKSRAAGVATLDSFLAQRAAGFGLQNFFTFGEGDLWKSHAPWHEGGAAYPSWTLLSLMNRFAAGEMLEVETKAVPTHDLKKMQRRKPMDDAPQIAVYAFRTENRMTVFVISRRVPGYPDPESASCTPVTIILPELSTTSVMLHYTGGAYDDHGVDGHPPPIQTVEIPADAIASGSLEINARTGAEECGLPAASAYIYTIESDSF